MDQDYTRAEDAVKNQVRQYGAGKSLDAAAPVTALQVDDVVIEGAPANTPAGRRGGFVQRIDEPTGDPTERLDVRLKLHLNAKDDTSGALETDLRAANQAQVESGVLQGMYNLFSKIELPDALGGGKLSDHYDWSNKTQEASKPHKEQVADLKTQVEAGLQQAGDAIPPEVAALLKHAKTFDADAGTVFGWDSSKPSMNNGIISVDFTVPSKNEGEKGNSAVVRDNILARKDAILDAIRDNVRTQHAAAGISEEALQKLDLHVSSSEDSYAGGINVTIGSKLDTPAKPGEPAVGPNALASLSEENLNRIVKDSILLKGQGAGDVAHLVAGDGDVRHFIELYKDKAPAFAQALEESEILKNGLSWREREDLEKKQQETKLITPAVTLLTGHTENGALQNDVQLAIDLPKNVTHDMVVGALEGKPIVLGPKTEALLKEKISAGQQAAQGSGQAA